MKDDMMRRQTSVDHANILASVVDIVVADQIAQRLDQARDLTTLTSTQAHRESKQNGLDFLDSSRGKN